MSSNASSARKLTNSLLKSESEQYLPPKRSHKESLRRDIQPPLANTRLSTLIYILVGLTALLIACFSYRTVQYKSKQQGWLSIFLHGRTSPERSATETSIMTAQKGGSDNIESHVLALAEALGIPTHELASVIAGAVRSYVPPASLSSIKAHETGNVVTVILQAPQPTSISNKGEGGSGAWAAASSAAEVVEEFVEGVLVESFVGMDEP